MEDHLEKMVGIYGKAMGKWLLNAAIIVSHGNHTTLAPNYLSQENL